MEPGGAAEKAEKRLLSAFAVFLRDALRYVAEPRQSPAASSSL